MNEEKRPNVLFIFMDAVRARNLSCFGYERQTSPTIDKIAGSGTVYCKAISTNNSTDKSLMSILSGRHILLGDKKDFLLSPEELQGFYNSGGQTLFSILQKEGYDTHWLAQIYGWQKKGVNNHFTENTENDKTSIVSKLKGNSQMRKLLRGMAHRMPKKISDHMKKKGGRTNGDTSKNEAIHIIKNHDGKPFFMWVHFDDSHIPFNPREHTGKFTVTEKGRSFFEEIEKKNINKEYVDFLRGAFNKTATFEEIIARYDESIYKQDQMIQEIIEALKEKGIYDDTILVIFSDHGESFDSHGIYFDHHGLYDVCTHVPIIMRGPGIKAGRINHQLVNHEDIVPTVLSRIGIDYHKEDFDGINLHGEEERTHTFSEECLKMKKRAIRTEKWKYIEAVGEEGAKCTSCNEVHGGVVELYNLETDPEEKENLANTNHMKLIEMKGMLEKELRERKMKNEKRRIKHSLMSGALKKKEEQIENNSEQDNIINNDELEH